MRCGLTKPLCFLSGSSRPAWPTRSRCGSLLLLSLPMPQEGGPQGLRRPGDGRVLELEPRRLVPGRVWQL